jgi:hypothetical protein
MRHDSDRVRRERPERFTRDGAVRVTLSQLALMHGLVDRPGSRTRSCKDWVDASVPYLWLIRHPSYTCFVKCSVRVPHAWVSRTRVGRSLECQLTDRGRAILERDIPAHVHGYGPYRGLRSVLRPNR